MKFNSFSSKGYSAFYQVLFLLGCTVSLFSCDYGDEIESLVQPNPDDFAVLYTDTVSVKLSTVGSDSLMTGGPSRMLVGSFTDPYLGKVRAANFFQPVIESGLSIPTLAEYDSLILSLRYDGYTYGDTTKPINVTVYKLLADIFDKSSYWNENSTQYDPVAIGKVRVIPTPRTSKNLKIKLSDALGKQMFEMGKNNQLTSNTDWLNLVKGLTIMPGANDNGAVVGFLSSGDSTSVQLHYHIPDVDQVRKDSTVLKLKGNYNQILGDRKGTALANLPSTRRIALPSAQSGNMSFIQAGTGVMTRVDFPSVRSMKSLKYTVANRAFLRITPLRSSVTDPFRVPSQLFVYRCDKNNEFYTGGDGYPLPLYFLTSSQPTQVFATYVNDYVNNKQYYLLDVSSFITDLMTSEIEDIGGLILRTSTFNTGESFRDANTEFSKSVGRLVIGDQQNSDPGVKLELYYTRVTVQ
jgi:hypothetical protein